MDMDFEVLQETLVVRLAGELDLHTASGFRHEVDKLFARRRGLENLVISLAGVTFIDSSGLGALLGRYKKVTEEDGRIFLVEANPGVCRLLKLAGINKVIPMVDTEREALQRLGYINHSR
jgi:stage II sporulation protein AA (anti-sigma F factor antagonist)